MKRFYYIAILFSIISASCSREIILTESELTDDVFYVKDQIKPFTGRCIIFYTGTERIKEELNFKKGLLDGKRFSYYSDGSLKTTGVYKKGEMDGLWQGFDKDGNKMFEVEYRKDSLEGRCITWNSDGSKKSSGTYRGNKKQDDWKYYPN